MVSVAAEKVTDSIGDGATNAEAKIWLISYGFVRLQQLSAFELLNTYCSLAYLFEPENDTHGGDE